MSYKTYVPEFELEADGQDLNDAMKNTKAKLCDYISLYVKENKVLPI